MHCIYRGPDSLVYSDTSALTPDGGLINGVGALSHGKHLKAVIAISRNFLRTPGETHRCQSDNTSITQMYKSVTELSEHTSFPMVGKYDFVTNVART